MRGVLTPGKFVLFNSLVVLAFCAWIFYRFKFNGLRGIPLKNFDSVSNFIDAHRTDFQSDNIASLLRHPDAEYALDTPQLVGDNVAPSRISGEPVAPEPESSGGSSPIDVPSERDEAFRERMNALQKSRQARLSAVCGNGSNVKTGSMGTVFNFQSLDLTYCCIAKCASTTFKVFLDKITGGKCADRDIHSCADSRFKQSRSSDDYRTNSLIIVRNPWERLVSSYTNKFVNEKFGNVAQPCYAYHGKLPNEYTITFAEFVECILHNIETGQRLNGHVAPISWHCSACHNNFSYIATLETFSDDLSYLFRYALSKAKSVEEYWAAMGQVKRRQSEVANTTRLTYSSSYKALNKEQLDRLVTVFQADARLFGYPTHPLNE